MSYKLGSEWRKWDLHVHSPASDGYSGTWENFENQLKNADCEVIGINDYFSVEGYKRIKEKIEKGDLDVGRRKILPVVEFRMRDVLKNKHTGHNGTNINFHVIFSDSISITKVETFIRSLEVDGSQIADRYTNLKFLRETAKVYFEKDVIDKLSANPDFKENFIAWLPYDEYGGIDEIDPNSDDWIKRGFIKNSNVLGSADKTHIDFFLWQSPLNKDGKEKFTAEQFKEWFICRKPCIKGSDSHSSSYPIGCLKDKDSKPTERYCWIKADPTFEGLKQIIYEPEERVFVGKEPEIEIRVRNKPTKYIKSLNITSVATYGGSHGTWFKDENIDFNKELVAIIGNKGTGKSAVTDIIGLLGNSHNQKYGKRDGSREELFSFLNKNKFLKPGYASNFQATLYWCGGESSCMGLGDEVNENIPERVEYLPQKYLEKICANIEDDEFRERLNEVIFGYVKGTYETTNFDDLIKYLTSQAEEDIKEAKKLLHDKNEEIISIEKRLTVDYKNKIEETIKIREDEILAHAKNKPVDKPAPAIDTEAAKKRAGEIEDADAKIKRLKEDIGGLEDEQKVILKEIEDIKLAKQAIIRQVSSLSDLKTKYKAFFEGLGLEFDDIVKLSIDYSGVERIAKDKNNRVKDIEAFLRTNQEVDCLDLDVLAKEDARSKSLTIKLAHLEDAKKDIIDKLEKPEQEYQEHLKLKSKWEGRQKELLGDEGNPASETLNWLKQELSNVSGVYINDRDALRQERTIVFQDIYRKKKSLISFYNSVKEAIDKEISKYVNDLGSYNITIEADLRFNALFYDEFFKYINQAVKGSFFGTDSGRGVLKNLCEGEYGWQDEKEVLITIENIIKYLDTDQRKDIPVADISRDIFKQMKQLKKPIDFYDYLFGLDYLETKYDLKVDGKDLSELSAGERGGLLLIFYLMLDTSDIPLVIDQPEDNLDNQSVYEILVTFLKKAKKRRQIIMVTHNPNLAVVADAEQIIHVSIDKKNKNDFNFVSGSIENPIINDRVVNILEGTMPAFDNRRLKYRKSAL